LLLSLTVVVIYGGMIWHVFPDVDKTISWEEYLAGLPQAILFAVRFKKHLIFFSKTIAVA
jgi:hypothetical protein